MAAVTNSDPALTADWLAVCRRASAGVRAMLAEHPETVDRERTTGWGEGGDMTLAIDRGAEEAIVREIEALGLGLRVIAEERGTVDLHGGGPVQVVVDPIDGSLNAKRGFPFHAVSVAVAAGPTMGDVTFAYVCDLGCGEEWWARRGEGAFLDGRRLPPLGDERPFELIGIESANPRIVAACAEQLAATGARRLRAVGAIALSLAFVAGTRLDAMMSLYDCRSVDAAAGQLLVRELGGAVSFPDAGGDPARVGLGLDMRSRVLAGATGKILETLLEALPEATHGRRRDS